MNCMSKKVTRAKAKLEDERKEAARQEYLNSLTDEERTKYLAAEQERQHRAVKLVTSALTLAAVPRWYNQ